jgi:hypothetical protein
VNRTHVYIVGAGFSKHAGLPLQKDFTEALLAPREDEDHPMQGLTRYLGKFVHHAFGHMESAKAKFWPNLEDLFTNIDLAANTGHHLGPNFAPSDLRTTRRVLLARMMCMLHERFANAESIKDPDWMKLDKFLNGLNIKRSSFISINWDTVIERRLAALQDVEHFAYGCGAIPARFMEQGNVIEKRHLSKDAEKLPLVKIHGSVNWLYCDNCRKLYWFPAEDAIPVAMQLIRHEEGKNVLKLQQVEACGKWRCLNCTKVPLTTRIATFSFLKALDFPMFEKSWFSAERLLRHAKKWIFIGYSLPAADYEFKHLLKRVQLSRSEPPEFVVITKRLKDKKKLKKEYDATYANYQGFFGMGIKRQVNYFDDGLTDKAIRAAHA